MRILFVHIHKPERKLAYKEREGDRAQILADTVTLYYKRRRNSGLYFIFSHLATSAVVYTLIVKKYYIV